jgi:type I restriction enzyme S subunit
LQTGDIPIDNLEITSFSQSLNEKGLQVSRLFPEGTLVLTIAATIGEIGLLKFDSCFPDSLVGINVNQAVVRKYFLLLSLRHWKERLILAAPESAQKNLNLDILNPFHVAVPPLNEQKEIESILISIQNHIEVKNNELSKFQSIKKSLMQDLLTGKVQVTVN